VPPGVSGNGSAPLLEVRDLVKEFESRDARLRVRRVRAVDGISFTVAAGETFAIVGESGSGKSTLGRLVLKLLAPTEGQVLLHGTEVAGLAERRFRRFRKQVQMVFQDPLAAFDPRMPVGRSLEEFLELRGGLGRAERAAAAAELIGQVGLDPGMARRYPAEMSGGQLQRLNVARALAPEPELVFLDEPTSALDVSIRGQIVNLLLDLRAASGAGYVLVAHDLHVVHAMADRVAVMYVGQFVEVGTRGQAFDRPLHPYTRGLIQATAFAGPATGAPAAAAGVRLRGELRAEHAAASGCRLVARCPFAEPRCHEPQPLTDAGGGHLVRCWKALEIERQSAG
jgi:oligopeptide/dipeptide ABC transporter ATP-binding protein